MLDGVAQSNNNWISNEIKSANLGDVRLNPCVPRDCNQYGTSRDEQANLSEYCECYFFTVGYIFALQGLLSMKSSR